MSETTPPDNPPLESSTVDVAANKTTNNAPNVHHPVEHRKGGGVWLALFMLLVLVAVGAGAYFLWHELQITRQRLDADSESTRQQLETLSHRTEQLEHQVGEALPGNIATLQNQEQALEEAIGKLRNSMEGDSRSWAIEETAALMEIANDRLRLESDIGTSLAALEAADRHLQNLKNPALTEVRRLLTNEINSLRSTPNPDITGMALSLGSLIEGIDRLPIAIEEPAKEQATATGGEKGWRGMLNDFWERLKALVVIKHRGEGDRALLAPDERYFLRQNLRLTLEEARIALLRRDKATYQQTLRSAQQWLALYFMLNCIAEALEDALLDNEENQKKMNGYRMKL